jgi:hypothetical protein
MAGELADTESRTGKALIGEAEACDVPSRPIPMIIIVSADARMVLLPWRRRPSLNAIIYSKHTRKKMGGQSIPHDGRLAGGRRQLRRDDIHRQSQRKDLSMDLDEKTEVGAAAIQVYTPDSGWTEVKE